MVPQPVIPWPAATNSLHKRPLAWLLNTLRRLAATAIALQNRCLHKEAPAEFTRKSWRCPKKSVLLISAPQQTLSCLEAPRKTTKNSHQPTLSVGLCPTPHQRPAAFGNPYLSYASRSAATSASSATSPCVPLTKFFTLATPRANSSSPIITAARAPILFARSSRFFIFPR